MRAFLLNGMRWEKNRQEKERRLCMKGLEHSISTEKNRQEKKQRRIIMEETSAIVKWQYKKDGVFELSWGDIVVLSAYARAYHVDGRMIDTRTAVLKKQEMTSDEKGQTLIFEAENGLILTEYLMVSESGAPMVSCSLSQQDGQEVEIGRSCS